MHPSGSAKLRSRSDCVADQRSPQLRCIDEEEFEDEVPVIKAPPKKLRGNDLPGFALLRALERERIKAKIEERLGALKV
jgi:hypothetical protein